MFLFDTDNEFNGILNRRNINVFINLYIVHATICLNELVNAETLKPKSTQQYKVYSKEITYKLKFPNTLLKWSLETPLGCRKYYNAF